MTDYKKIPTSAEVWLAIKERHPELVVFDSYHKEYGYAHGNPDKCMMQTAHGFIDSDYPIIYAEKTWDKPKKVFDKKLNENCKYWLCVGINDD